jgi:BASS family bile acid:Na+ symporter
LVPVFAIGLSALFALPPEIEFSLVALTVSPVPPEPPVNQIRANSPAGYAIGLVVAAAVISIAATPLLVIAAGHALAAQAHIHPSVVARIVALSIAAPLCVGLVLKAWRPTIANRLSGLALPAGQALQLVAVVLLVLRDWPVMARLVTDGGLVSITVVVVLALALGHLLGGPDQGCRMSLALAAATRHPGVAVAIAVESFPDRIRDAVAAILVFLLVRAIVTASYLWWMRQGRPVRSEVPKDPST